MWINFQIIPKLTEGEKGKNFCMQRFIYTGLTALWEAVSRWGGSKKGFHCTDKKSNLESQFFRKYLFFCTLQLDCVNGIKMTHILIIFQKNMEVAVFTENRVRGESLKKDFV